MLLLKFVGLLALAERDHGTHRTHTHFVYYESHKMHKDQLQTRTTTFYEQFLFQFDDRAFSVQFGNECQNVVVGCLVDGLFDDIQKNTHTKNVAVMKNCIIIAKP